MTRLLMLFLLTCSLTITFGCGGKHSDGMTEQPTQTADEVAEAEAYEEGLQGSSGG